MSAVGASAGVQVLAFTFGEETYCIDIEYVTEIVDGGEMTPIPNTADHVAGVMDLRGRTTTIVDPRVLLDDEDVSPDDPPVDGGGTHHRIVVFDPETVETDGAIGWVVSDVAEVTHVPEDSVESGPVTDTDFFRGVVKRDDGFLLWLHPDAVTT